MTPLVFEGCAGWLHAAGGDVGVLLCSPLGMEELCLRRAWRMLADLCAEAGYPALRFDYPGCGDSAGRIEAADGVDRLVGAVRRAAEELRLHTGVSRLVLVGHGLGAALAALAACQVGAEALALLAPVVRGGAELSALALWSREIAAALRLPAGDAEQEGVAGFALPPRLCESIAALDLTTAQTAPAERVFLAARPDRALDVRLADRLRAQWADLTLVHYDEHAAALEPPTLARPPAALFAALVRWLRRAAPMGPPGAVPSLDDTAALVGEGFGETFVRFGPAGRLAGVLCEPDGRRAGAVVLLLNAGGDPHTGWARGGVERARALARRGAASLRIDLSGLGDSAGALTSEPPRVCDRQHLADTSAALDWLEGRGLGPVLAAGRCSGASVAFAAALRDPRIRDLMLINPRRFLADFDDFAQAADDRLAHYRARLQTPAAVLRRAFRGEIDLRAAAWGLGGAAARRAYAAASGYDRRLRRRLFESFEALSRRGVRTSLIYSETGPAWAELQQAFGPGGGRLRGLPGVEIRRIAGADQNFTLAAARVELAELLCTCALSPAATPPQASAPGGVRDRSPAFGTAPETA